MQQYMKALNLASGGSNASTMGSFNRAVLKVNPNHPIVRDLERVIVVMQGDRDIDARNFAILLYNVAALMSGYKIEDLGDFAGRILPSWGVGQDPLTSGGGGNMDAKVEKRDDIAMAVIKEEEDMVVEEENGDNVDATTMAAMSDGILDVEVEKTTTTDE